MSKENFNDSTSLKKRTREKWVIEHTNGFLDFFNTCLSFDIRNFVQLYKFRKVLYLIPIKIVWSLFFSTRTNNCYNFLNFKSQVH